MPSVSAIILTRDSQRTIEACVKALKPAVDHVIVVDTGSTDDTVQIAKANGAYVYHFEWRDDFAAARNFGDSLATSEWIIHVDSDEILREEDVGKIRNVCAKFRRMPGPNVVTIDQLNIMSVGAEVTIASRMYKRGVLVWKDIIHEQLYSKHAEMIGRISSDICLIHDGYNHNVVDQYNKIVTRNIRLLKKGLENEPENASYHYFLGRDYTVMNENAAAIPHLKYVVASVGRLPAEIIDESKKLLAQCLETAPTVE